jgi:hypothetical protein
LVEIVPFPPIAFDYFFFFDTPNIWSTKCLYFDYFHKNERVIIVETNLYFNCILFNYICKQYKGFRFETKFISN